jgi:hypothetical protein
MEKHSLKIPIDRESDDELSCQTDSDPILFNKSLFIKAYHAGTSELNQFQDGIV